MGQRARRVGWGGRWLTAACVLGASPVGSVGQVVVGGTEHGADRLYGRIHAASGEVVEGYLTWDGTAGVWADVLTGSREMPAEYLAEAVELGAASKVVERAVEFMGYRITWNEEVLAVVSTTGIRFGHLESITFLSDGSVMLVPKERSSSTGPDAVDDGTRGVVLQSLDRLGASGRALSRGVTVHPTGAGEPMRFAPGAATRIDFLATPGGSFGPDRTRLHGTVTDHLGRAFTGYVTWDLDEAFGDDVLDADLQDASARFGPAGSDVRIPFREVAFIERVDRSSARAGLGDGTTVLLDGSNDVDRGNRGVRISDATLGVVEMGWSEFVRLDLHPPVDPVPYEGYDGGRPLRGIVTTTDGTTHEGRVRWDNDEARSWEILDGAGGGVDFDFEFAAVRSIERPAGGDGDGDEGGGGDTGVVVTLVDGRRFEVAGSNDVSSENKGVFVEGGDGTVVLVAWPDFARVDFVDLKGGNGVER